MSDRPEESSLPGPSKQDVPSKPAQDSDRSPPAPKSAQPGARDLELPPLRAVNTHGIAQAGQARSASFSNILNPARSDEPQNRRRKASELQSPSSLAAYLPPMTTASQSPNTALSNASPVFVPPQGRRILTPRSPSLHRAASLGQLNSGPASVDARTNLFPPSPRARTYTVEPGAAGVPPLPTPQLSARPGYGFPVAASPVEVERTDGRTDLRARSVSLSPRSSYQAQFRSPAQTSPDSAFPVSSTYQRSDLSPAESSHASLAEMGRPMGIPISSAAGQSVYQMMTLQTTSGAVQVPVDIQAASRVADEKRRRNAGASARFRARRKEKEKESSSTIAKLEMQVKELSEEVEFYRRERGYLAGVVLQVPGGERHFPRPPSPRHRRASAGLPGASTSGSASTGYLSGQEAGPGDGRNVRRRTSTLSLPVPGPSQPSGPVYQQAYYDPPQPQPRHLSYPAAAQPQQPYLPGPSTILPAVSHAPALAPRPTQDQQWHRPHEEQRPDRPHEGR